ncbi:hypothetical protein [Endozoicomonas arenosclerae]|uniref:hypothetical protein n=1 Tax=Endozoicomonas arenosclerae TaxID=1633495 RepID=UPI000783AAAC|nr:hypothetical protein [Endozoicomonas arenosclerae]
MTWNLSAGFIPSAQKTATFLSAIALSVSAANANNLPPENPYLADSTYPITHVTSAQQGAIAVQGPEDKNRRLTDKEKEYIYTGPSHLIFSISGQYDNGKRVIWSSGSDRLIKQDYDTFEVIDTVMLREDEGWDEAWSEERMEKVASGWEPLRIYNALQEMLRFAEAGGIYPMMDADNNFYLGSTDGTIQVYGDSKPDDPSSTISLKHRYQIKAPVTGKVNGFNISYDGYITAVTDDGWMVAMSRDFKEQYQIKLEGAPQESYNKEDPLSGWVRNSFAMDPNGMTYVVSRDFLHGVKWTGKGWSQDAKDGAWIAPYSNTKGFGSGSTPSLMGFGQDDKLVVITDGDELMNLTLFWREAIPEDWKGLPGEDRRVAGKIAANMAREDLKKVQSEQSVAVYGYGAVIVNNQPPSLPFYAPDIFAPVFVGLLGNEEDYKPHGIQKFVWDTQTRTLNQQWVNNNISSPNSVPVIAAYNDMIYTGGVRDGEWTLEALDWNTGTEKFHWILGDNKYNTNFAPLAIDPQGRITYGTTWGRVRLNPAP